jgi:hypothetical protein
MERLGLVETDRVGNAKVVRANTRSPYAKILKQLLSAEGRSSGRVEEAEHAKVRSWMAHYGAPVMTSGVPERNVPGLEQVLVRALRLSHDDASLTRTLPVVIWQNRLRLDLDVLIHGALQADQGQTLGFLLELTGMLSGEETFRQAAERLRDKRYRREVFFFYSDGDSQLSRDLAEKRAPAVARRWKFLMNMPLDSFESMFKKATSLDGNVQPSPASAVREGARSGAPQPGAAHRDRRRRGGVALRRKA